MNARSPPLSLTPKSASTPSSISSPQSGGVDDADHEAALHTTATTATGGAPDTAAAAVAALAGSRRSTNVDDNDSSESTYESSQDLVMVAGAEPLESRRFTGRNAPVLVNILAVDGGSSDTPLSVPPSSFGRSRESVASGYPAVPAKVVLPASTAPTVTHGLQRPYRPRGDDSGDRRPQQQAPPPMPTFSAARHGGGTADDHHRPVLDVNESSGSGNSGASGASGSEAFIVGRPSTVSVMSATQTDWPSNCGSFAYPSSDQHLHQRQPAGGSGSPRRRRSSGTSYGTPHTTAAAAAKRGSDVSALSLGSSFAGAVGGGGLVLGGEHLDAANRSTSPSTATPNPRTNSVGGASANFSLASASGVHIDTDDHALIVEESDLPSVAVTASPTPQHGTPRQHQLFAATAAAADRGFDGSSSHDVMPTYALPAVLSSTIDERLHRWQQSQPETSIWTTTTTSTLTTTMEDIPPFRND